jgi:hypothetical protein
VFALIVMTDGLFIPCWLIEDAQVSVLAPGSNIASVNSGIPNPTGHEQSENDLLCTGDVVPGMQALHTLC